MYNIIKTRSGQVLILNELIAEINPLLEKTISSLNTQVTEADLLAWVVDIFSDDFEERYGEYPQELLEKFALSVINARFYLITDIDQFCEDFNSERLDLEIGFEKTFYPVGTGHWYNTMEFLLMLEDS